jgi:hypothetical protein
LKHPAAVMLGIAALLVTGCGTDARADEATDYLTPGAVLPAPALTNEELHEKAFLDYVRRAHPALQFADGDRIITIATTFCRMYDQGGAADDAHRLIRAARGTGTMYTVEELATISGSGVASFCPEHVDELRRDVARQKLRTG